MLVADMNEIRLFFGLVFWLQKQNPSQNNETVKIGSNFFFVRFLPGSHRLFFSIIQLWFDSVESIYYYRCCPGIEFRAKKTLVVPWIFFCVFFVLFHRSGIENTHTLSVPMECLYRIITEFFFSFSGDHFHSNQNFLFFSVTFYLKLRIPKNLIIFFRFSILVCVQNLS